MVEKITIGEIEKYPFEYGKEIATPSFERFCDYYDEGLKWKEESGLDRFFLPDYPGINPEIVSRFLFKFRIGKKQNTLEKISLINNGKRSFDFIGDIDSYYNKNWSAAIMYESIKMDENKNLFKTDLALLLPCKKLNLENGYVSIEDVSGNYGRGVKLKSDKELDKNEIESFYNFLCKSINLEKLNKNGK